MTNLIFLIKVVTNLAQNWHVMDAKMCYYSSMENYLRVTFSMPIIYVEICIICTPSRRTAVRLFLWNCINFR